MVFLETKTFSTAASWGACSPMTSAMPLKMAPRRAPRSLVEPVRTVPAASSSALPDCSRTTP